MTSGFGMKFAELEFAVGQRWVSHTETDLGLGIITDIDGRLVNISFPAAAERRTYAVNNAPLSRIEYKPGDTITTTDELSFIVQEVTAVAGRLLYVCHDDQDEVHQIDELNLNCFVILSTPRQRLTSGQLDDLKAYQLRCETLEHVNRLQQSSVKGLLGSRTSFLPHQIYIASEVARRYAPRVLLADEVGLGKTIEAGMILHYQLHTGMARRVLIIVPDTLVHQWLVEMLRRFNLNFAIFNQDRLAALAETEGNPFDSEQLIICAREVLLGQDKVLSQALEADWDMVVVDEAHHLHLHDAAEVDAQDPKFHEYQCIEALAQKTRGLLLLTATPEQAGIDNHFARLRLLDPARFHSFEAFTKEAQSYRQLNDILQAILAAEREKDETKGLQLPDEMLKELSHWLDESPQQMLAEPVDQLIAKLLDRHGTGRVFMRNTRSAIKGFPERELKACPLPLPALYECITGREALCPELQVDKDLWLAEDARVAWLVDLLKKIKPQKVLVICANASTASALERYLHLRVGIRSAAFFEDLSIIERDRAAAWFADDEGGAQVLVCSEIGSEGRNFQFAHHLVLFDLPMNPDLLEQRIGRLDRIGQKHPINIHVPYFEHSAQQVLFDWLDGGLNIFRESCSGASSIYETFEQKIDAALLDSGADHSALVEETAGFTQALKEKMESGRDRLIELNSCNPVVANGLIEQIQAEENPELMSEFLVRMFDVYGVDHENHSEHTWVLHPTNHMRTGHFPGLNDDGTTITFSRDVALSREDIEFASWEHPMLSEAMAMTLNSELGNASVATIKLVGVQPGTLLLEAFYSIAYVAPEHLRVDRYLPLSPFRTLVGAAGKDLSGIMSHEKLNDLCVRVKRHTAQKLVKQIRNDIDDMVTHTQRLSEQALPAVLEQAQHRARSLLEKEIARLHQLQTNNHTIRHEEIGFLEEQLGASLDAIESARFEMQALRLVVVTQD